MFGPIYKIFANWSLVTPQNDHKTSRNLMEMVSDVTFKTSRSFQAILWNFLEPIGAIFGNGLNPLKLSYETIANGFLLLLRSFWVVTWPVYDKWPKMAWISEKWHSKPFPLDFCLSIGHFEWSHDWSATILNWGPKWPKKAPNDQKWPECLKSD